MASAKKRGLGRGLNALIPEGVVDPAGETAPPSMPGADNGQRVLELDPHELVPNPHQPRVHFDEAALEELAESLKNDGIQEPVIVRRVDGKYQIVSGERRVRAAIMADLETVPAICRDVPDSEMLKLGLIENIQREDLNPIETARAYHMLIEQFGWTQEVLAQQVGKKRVTVTNILRLRNLPQTVQDAVSNGDISMGHARAILALDTPQKQIAACRKAVAEGLSVRQVEKMAAPPKPKPGPATKDPNIASIEDDLRRALGTRVSLRSSGNNRGKIEIEYFNLDELERLLGLLRSTR